MSDTAPNFRVLVRHDEDTEAVATTLHEVLADNEGAPFVCQLVAALKPGGEARLSNGWIYTRPVVSPPRYTRVRVPIAIKEFRDSTHATVTIDRKRLTMSVRPLRKRTVVELSLTEIAELYLAKQVRLNAIAKNRARRSRR